MSTTLLTPPLVDDPSLDLCRQTPDGDWVFVGELTGVTGVTSESVPLYETGLSRVWKIDADAHQAVCSEGSSGPCEVAIEGLTSVIDVAFGPDGRLYVAEFDTAGWLAAFPVGSGGAVVACDVSGTLPIQRDACDEVVSPRVGVVVDAITFDKWRGLWVLENGLFAPRVRRVSP